MAYKGLAWPGLTQSVAAINRAKAVHARTLKLVTEQPKLFKRPKSVRMRTEALLADLNTGLAVLRDAERAARPDSGRPKRSTRL